MKYCIHYFRCLWKIMNKLAKMLRDKGRYEVISYLVKRNAKMNPIKRDKNICEMLSFDLRRQYIDQFRIKPKV